MPPAQLKQRVPGSEGTQFYLWLMESVRRVFYDGKLSPLERLSLLGRVVYCVRHWRSWVLKSGHYALNENFITTNLYHCLEINMHSLVLLIRRFKQLGLERLFKLSDMNSQPCEDFFRKMRSQTSTYSTVIKFSFLQLLHRIRRYESITDFEAQYSNEQLSLPKAKRVRSIGVVSVSSDFSLPGDDEIKLELWRARIESQRIMKALIPDDVLSAFGHQVPNVRLSVLHDSDSDDDSEENTLSDKQEKASATDTESGSESDGIFEDLPVIAHCVKHQVEKNWVSEPVTNMKNSRFCLVKTSDGSITPIKKSTLLWLLRESSEKLSSDRLKRVMVQGRRVGLRESPQTNAEVGVKSELRIGEWCVYRPVGRGKRVLVGRVIQFGYLSGRRCHSVDTQNMAMPFPDDIGILCQWFRLNADLTLTAALVDQGYCDSSLYIMHSAEPVSMEIGTNIVFGFDSDVFTKLNSFIQKKGFHFFDVSSASQSSC